LRKGCERRLLKGGSGKCRLVSVGAVNQQSKENTNAHKKVGLLLLRRSRTADSGLELDDAKVCVLSDRTTQLHLASYFGANHIIRHVGNYGEVYDRNVGVDSELGIPRGLNQLWNAGGILYAPPIR
jgi:hypothetical protein